MCSRDDGDGFLEEEGMAMAGDSSGVVVVFPVDKAGGGRQDGQRWHVGFEVRVGGGRAGRGPGRHGDVGRLRGAGLEGPGCGYRQEIVLSVVNGTVKEDKFIN